MTITWKLYHRQRKRVATAIALKTLPRQGNKIYWYDKHHSHRNK
jgi:hypothetical protein